jgi:hypothetical protein
MTPTEAVYVYGVVPSGTPAAVFAHVEGMDPAHDIRLLEADGVAAVTSRVPLAEFGEEVLEPNLKDPAWLERRVQAHNAVLAAATVATTVVPFRFGAIYRGEDQVRAAMLAQRRELAETLSRLDGVVELGVKATLDQDALRERLARAHEPDDKGSAGRAYMLRKRLEQQLDEEVRTFAATCADESHRRLAAVARDARANPAQHPSVAGEMILNGAYLVARGDEGLFGAGLEELQDRFRDEGVMYELTGPWPPYNFVEGEAAP